MEGGEFEVVVFTSSIQLDHLLGIAAEMGLESDVMRVLRNQVVIASVGPVMTPSLEARGLPPDVIPQTPKMGALIKATGEEAPAALQRKLVSPPTQLPA